MRCFSHLLIPGLVIAIAVLAPPKAVANLPRATESAPPAYAGLLGKYASPAGVRYGAWHDNAADIQALASVVEFYANNLPPSDRDASLAWHLNAYNAWILHNILKKYPTRGPLEGDDTFFSGENITIAGQRTSFDHLEKNIIGPTFKDPRTHFALNCASASCPPLHTKPFSADTLNADLDRLTRGFINDHPQGVVSGRREVKVSKLFDWYAADFGGSDNIITFINLYRREPLPANTRIGFLDYSWDLNEVR